MPKPPPRSDATDAELLVRARRDPAAFHTLYTRHAQRVHAFLLRRTHSETVAYELTAETFAQAWLARSRFADLRDGSAAPWLFGIARNVLAQSARRAALERDARDRLGLTVDARACEAPIDERWLDGLDEDIEAALGELSEEERRAVELRVLQDQPYEAVGAALDITPGAARVRVFRALGRMRHRLSPSPARSDR
jgi:RNA polymerase sigma factor (sigma-70 family)